MNANDAAATAKHMGLTAAKILFAQTAKGQDVLTDDLIEAVATAIKAELGKQMNAQPIHPDPAVDDWAATGGEIDLSDVARAAIRAAAPLILDMAADDCRTYSEWHNKMDDGLSGFDKMSLGAKECADIIRQLKERFQ